MPRRHNRANWVGLRTLRQIPKVVGQTEAGEVIYEVRSVRLLLRGDAAHFNRLVRCSKCGREVAGRAVLGPADLDQAPQPVVCNDCVEAVTAMSPRPGPPAEPAAADEPAVADARAEMNRRPEAPVNELGGLGDDEAEGPDVLAPEEAEDDALVDDSDEMPPAEEEPPAVDVELMDDGAGLDEDELPTLDEYEPVVADVALEEVDAAVPADHEFLAGLDDEEAPAPADDEPVVADAGLDDEEAPAPVTAAPASAGPRPVDDGLTRRIEALEERLAGADHPDPLRLVALEETVNRLAERADANASLEVAIQTRIDELGGAPAAQDQKENDELRRRLDQLGERLDQLQGTIDAEWARTKSETATLGQTVAELGERVLRLAEQAGDTAGAGNERLAVVEEKVDEATTRLAKALESQRRQLEDGLREGLADVRSAIPRAPAPAEDVDGRLRAMEKQVRQGQAEVSELNELHAALDAGLGSLRAEIGEVRAGLARLTDAKADLEDRLETFLRMSLVPEGEKGRKAKKAAEATLGTMSAAVQDLLREQRQLKDSVASLEQASDAATAAAARASMQASSLGPLRSDVKLLHQEAAEQQQALDALRRTVERLRPPPAAAPSPATRRSAKKAPPAKAAPAAKAGTPAKRAAAKAAIARAAATQAATAKAAAAKKAARAKKA